MSTLTNLKLIPDADLQELAAKMNSKYAPFMKGRRFEISCQRDFQKVDVKVVLRNEDESFYYPVHGRMEFNKEEMGGEEASLFLIDYIDMYFEEFFDEDEMIYVPIEWAAYEYDAIEFELKGQIQNLKAERLADEMLGRSFS